MSSKQRVFSVLMVRALSHIGQARGSFMFSGVTIALSLFVLLILVMLLINFHQLTSEIRKNILAVAFISASSESEAQAAVSDIQALSKGLTVELLAPENALKRVRAKQSGDLAQIWSQGDWVMPWVAIVRSRINDAATNLSLYKNLERNAHIEHLVSPGEEMKGARWVVSFIYGAGFLIVGLLSILVIVIVMNVIRLSVLRRRSEIQIMRLVGATEAFVCAPFIIEGFLLGLIGATFAVLLVTVFHLMSGSLTDGVLLDNFKWLELRAIPRWALGATVMFGSGLGALGALLSTLGSNNEDEWGPS